MLLEHIAGILGLFRGVQRRLSKRINTNLILKAEWSQLYKREKRGTAQTEEQALAGGAEGNQRGASAWLQ